MGDIKSSNSFRSVTKELKFEDIVEIDLQGKARFFHGSPNNFAPEDKEQNPKINLDFCNGDNKDFGKGFYLSATPEFCGWYIKEGGKSANSGIPVNCDHYYLYQCSVDKVVESLPNYLNLTNNLRALTKICYTGRFHCTEDEDVLSDYDAVLGWMVDDLNFVRIKRMLLSENLLVEDENPDFDGNVNYVGLELNTLTDNQLDRIGDLIFLNDKHGAYQLAIKNKDIAENENYVTLHRPTREEIRR